MSEEPEEEEGRWSSGKTVEHALLVLLGLLFGIALFAKKILRLMKNPEEKR